MLRQRGGEVIFDLKRGDHRPYNAALSDIEVRPGDSPMERRIFSRHGGFDLRLVPYPQLVLFTPLSPKPGQVVAPLSPACPLSPRCCSNPARPPAQNFRAVGSTLCRNLPSRRGAMDRAYTWQMAGKHRRPVAPMP